MVSRGGFRPNLSELPPDSLRASVRGSQSFRQTLSELPAVGPEGLLHLSRPWGGGLEGLGLSPPF
ncbi:MAG: hypothetical protein SOZ58_04660 [Prevotella sp.]|nr:hypothetical protein [Prevotella sp.]